MGLIFALDPGTRRLGLAVGNRDRVLWALGIDLGRARTPADVATVIAEAWPVAYRRDFEFGTLVAEWPQVRDRFRVAEDVINDMREVVVCVETAAPWARRRRIPPEAWKGQVPKPVHQTRIERELAVGEATAINWSALSPDGRDAVGILLWASGRLKGIRKPKRLP